jgi:MFS transporter, PAT family, beta-lactamase induction signal transducer AmpG
MAAVRRLALLTLLYFCQGLPGGFLAQTLPIVVRTQGGTLLQTNLVQLVGLPWLGKLLWAPFVDRWGSERFGRRKTWMVPALAGMIACTFAVGFFDPRVGLTVALVLFLLLNIFAATQDIAVDGFTVASMQDRDLGPANAAQVGGFKLGNIAGGGVLLLFIGAIGWLTSFTIMTACLVVALLAVLFTREPPSQVGPPVHMRTIVRGALDGLFAVPAFAAFLFAAKFAESIAGVLIQPAMVDHGFDFEQIGLVDGIFGGVATVVGAVAGGVMTRRIGWARTTMIMSAVQGVGLAAAAIYQAGEVTTLGFGLLRAWEKLGGGGTAVAIFALAMSRCRPEIASTEFTAVQTFYMVGGMVSGLLASIAGDIVGIGPVMIVGALATIVTGVVADRFRDSIDPPGMGTRTGMGTG